MPSGGGLYSIITCQEDITYPDLETILCGKVQLRFLRTILTEQQKPKWIDLFYKYALAINLNEKFEKLNLTNKKS